MRKNKMETSLNYNDNLPYDHQDIDSEDPRIEIYWLYANHVYEDFESFCDRMSEEHGDNWVNKFTRKTRDR